MKINFDKNTECTVLELTLCIVLVPKKIEAYILIQVILCAPE